MVEDPWGKECGQNGCFINKSGGENMLSNIEKETIIIFNDSEKTASVYTCNKSLKNKLDRFCSEEKEFTIIREDEYSKTYLIPKNAILVFVLSIVGSVISTFSIPYNGLLIAKERFKNRHAAVKDNG